MWYSRLIFNIIIYYGRIMKYILVDNSWLEERGNFSDPKISCRCLPLETVIRSQISGKRREGWGQKPFEVFSKIHPILGTEAPLNFKNESLSKVAFDFHLPISIKMMEIEKISFCHGRDSLTCVAVSLLSPALHGNATLEHTLAYYRVIQRDCHKWICY